MPRAKKTALTQARGMRRIPTDAERKLWSLLRRRQIGGWYFRRQHPIPPYIADFACIEAKLVVEVDGGQHNGSSYDAARDRRMKNTGWRVMRFWNTDVLSNPEGVARMIWEVLSPLPDPPPPAAGKGDWGAPA
ncbi:endonuclease domain-containing protein [Azospirillum sp. CT11-132]|uniref:endonuclease domain-containing protein n=1 Tax=Azospirillum sp. CT11-132 TaxID=3396317 RepID=UPI0039A784EA